MIGQFQNGIIFLKIYLLLLYMFECLSACMHVNPVHALCRLRPEENVALSKTLVTDVCEPPCGRLE